MIYLFAIVLSVGSTNPGGWIEGDYSFHAAQHATIAACESARANMIAFAKTQARRTLISKCSVAGERVEFHSYTADKVQS